jgi:tetratricopeptide (TPR) repeat protein
VALAALIVVTAWFTVNLLLRWRQGCAPNPWKLALMVSAFAYFWYCNATLANLLIAYALFELFHDIQYLAIVWVFNRNRVRKNPQLGGLTRFLFRPRLPFVGLYLLLIFAYGALDHGVTRLAPGTLQNVLLGVFLTSTLLHYYLDGFIWKLREPSNQTVLNVRDSGYGSLIDMPPWLRHACYWGLFFIPLIGLTVSQLWRPAPGFTQACRLVAITPNSLKAQVRAAQAWEARDDKDRAIAHYQKAVDLRPDVAALQTQLVHLLTHQGNDLARNGQLEEAQAYFERALRIRPFDRATQRALRQVSSAGQDGVAP